MCAHTNAQIHTQNEKLKPFCVYIHITFGHVWIHIYTHTCTYTHVHIYVEGGKGGDGEEAEVKRRGGNYRVEECEVEIAEEDSRAHLQVYLELVIV